MKTNTLIILFFVLSIFLFQGNGHIMATSNSASKTSCEAAGSEAAKESAGTLESVVPESVVTRVIDLLVKKHGKECEERVRKGVTQAAALWRKADGDAAQFETFCLKGFIASEKEREMVFKKLERYYEVLKGHFNKIELDLKENLDLVGEPLHAVDRMFGSYDVSAHFDQDFYGNKIAFVVVLNFPYYSLEEKRKLGPDWSSLDWAYARLGDIYTARIPAQLLQTNAQVGAGSDVYISGYNIFMGHVFSKKGEKLFPENLRLLSHWNLRDELKSHYGLPGGLAKQETVYRVMERIVAQEIPQMVIDNKDYDWDPFKNKVYKDGKAVDFKREPDSRYQQILDNFRAKRAMDSYYPPAMNTFIKRSFAVDMEIAQPDVEKLFIQFVSSPQVKKVARLIRKRLKRKLRPFDIWYNGFKGRGGLSEEKLNAITKKKYPNAAALKKDLPQILLKLGFPKDRAQFLASKISVDPARGSGHAWGASMRAENAHLRTRIGGDGMDYKGYNIAIHEFGHNVEQTISLQDVDYYMLRGVPNNSFTEALAFSFQARDLQLLGIGETDEQAKHLEALDTFWSVYEIMGVSLVDMNLWKWMYANPDADAAQLREAVIRIAKDIWNKYYAGVFGVKDQAILGIYSHMISSPLYLSAYSYGHLINFQLEQHFVGKDFAAEVQRVFSTGCLIPQLWMKKAVGKDIAVEPLVEATGEALKHIKK